MRRVRGTRSVSALYGTLSVVLLVAALVMALIVRPPPPPSIAQLGPSPQEQIEEARENQAAGTGNADVATAPEEKEQTQASAREDDRSATTTPPTTTSTAKKVPGTRRCFGNPPRQTEDPHSPPCVFEIFEGDNGGDTAPGVTGTEIHVALERNAAVSEELLSAWEALVAHFNKRYEFYGRRIIIDWIDTNQTSDTMLPADSKALADEVIDRRPFASALRLPRVFHSEFHRRLAQSGIHSIQYDPPAFNSDQLIDGWTWSLIPPSDIRQSTAGDFVCHAFHGRNARHAGGGVSGKRKFAVVATTIKNTFYPDTDPLMNRLNSCSANATDFELDEFDPQARENLITELLVEGYTTVIMVGENGHSGAWLLQSAAQRSYYPEWLTFDMSYIEHDESRWHTPPGRKPHGPQAFGFTSLGRVRSEEEQPAFWAVQDGGESGNIGPLQQFIPPIYNTLLVLASGVQMAGPNLTPESFRHALWETVWPNPNPGAPPHWQQRVSFAPGDPVFYDDYAIWWWNENAPSQTRLGDEDGRGSFCYLNRGSRFLPGTFPGDADRRLGNEQEEPCR